MEVPDKPQLIFYQKMGELFYAIAAADKVVRKAEYQSLKNIVVAQWKDLDDYKDSFGTYAAYQIEVVFNWFDYEQLDSKDCFESFADYKKENPKLFSKERKELIWKTANVLAASFSGKNKDELIMLAKLKSLLQL